MTLRTNHARRILTTVISSVLLTGLSGLATVSAQDSDFPRRPLRLVVPYPPGGAPDAIARVVAEEAGKRLGQAIVVDNKPGAGTAIGTMALKNAPADGHTLLLQTNGLAYNTYLIKQPGYSLDDFMPLATVADTSYVMLVSTKVPAKTLAEFVSYAKANPGKVNYGSVGRSTLASRLSAQAGFEWTEINFKGIVEAAHSVMSNEVQAFFSTQGYASMQVGSDKLRLMAVTSSQRLDIFPDVPTFKESGYPALDDSVWYALFARRDTPKPAAGRLQRVFSETMRSVALKEALKKNGLAPIDPDLDAFQVRMKSELTGFIADARRFGIQPQ